MIVWRLNSANTTHLFLWEKIVPFGFGVLASLWVQTTGFGVCLQQSLNDSPGHLSNTQRQRMTIENLILNGLEHIIVFRKQNNVKTPLSEMKSLLPSILKLFEDFFCM